MARRVTFACVEFWDEEDEGSDDDDREIGVQEYEESSPVAQAPRRQEGAKKLAAATSESVPQTQKLESPHHPA